MSAASNQRQQNGTKEANYALQNAQAAAASELLQVALFKFRPLKYNPFLLKLSIISITFQPIIMLI